MLIRPLTTWRIKLQTGSLDGLLIETNSGVSLLPVHKVGELIAFRATHALNRFQVADTFPGVTEPACSAVL